MALTEPCRRGRRAAPADVDLRAGDSQSRPYGFELIEDGMVAGDSQSRACGFELIEDGMVAGDSQSRPYGFEDY